MDILLDILLKPPQPFIGYFFYLKLDRFPVVSVLNKFMKMNSNTISIVHSNLTRKESLYYLFRPYFCHEQTPVLGICWDI